jgi:RNase P/RNase MRP subunit p29
MRAAMLCSIALVVTASSAPAADVLSGTYVEVRTCQVYTGPCFANGEVGSAGKNAIMTWQITDGRIAETDLAGLSVTVVVKSSHTLGFKGLDNARTKKAMLIIDSAADAQQAAVLKEFALLQTNIAEQDIAGLHRADIDMEFDHKTLTATVNVGRFARLKTRKARSDDCICSNESAYYPPLTRLNHFVPGVTIEGEVTARRLGTRWSVPDSRTAYLGTFEVAASNPQQLAAGR